ncbi:phosphate transport system regulatory protein PhoU [Candidatus Marinamargulisbacteria bacterium SCGC AAA071-K20]|nr:phosphate transport system regulatory protein PhoU [Candidatus Marinamargulisbacteria bacterium SCGC AAA071-K20]
MSNPLQKAIKDLNKLFLSYCAEVEQNVHLAVQSFMKTEPKNVQLVIDKDKEIDQMEIAIEEECLRIMAMYQPLAKDLRFIVGILKINNDLERIGDLAVNIVKKVTIFTDRETSLSKHGNAFFLPEMIQKVLDMLKNSLDSFTKQDPKLAREVCQLDDEVDQLKQDMKVLVLNKMKEDPEKIKPLSGILRNSYHLERIADLSTNIAEDVIYLVEGDIIRHGGPFSASD